MIKLWFRSKSAITRRSIPSLPEPSGTATRGSNVSAAPWRLQFKHLTTLFYSSIIATAAAVDVKAKQARSEQWATVISEVEKSLQEDRHRGEPAIPEPGGVFDRNSDAELHDPADYAGPLEVEVSSKRSQELNTELAICLDRRSEVYEKNKRLPGIGERARVAPQSIYATPFRRSRHSTLWTRKKLVTTELTVGRLTTRLLLEAIEIESNTPIRNHSLNKDFGTFLTRSNLETRLDEISTALKDARESDTDNNRGIETIDFPKYQPYSDGLADVQRELNKAMVLIFRKYAMGKLRLGELLSKIAYNLLISEAPPDLATWTMLISRFSLLHQNTVVDMVLEAIEDAHIRPNEMTICATLAHYVRKGDIAEYHHYIGKLEGYHGGLMLARSNVKIGIAGTSRLHQRGNKIIQRIALDAHIYYGIISGYLALRNLSVAMIWYRRMLNDNFKADLRLLTQFLRFFGLKRDWDRGLGIWTSITTHFLVPKTLYMNINRKEELQSAYHFMLKLCRVCQKPQHFQDTYRQGLLDGFTMEMLLIGQSIRRRLSAGEDFRERLRRRARILEHRAFLLAQDLHRWAVQALASKIILSGVDVVAVQAAFKKHADGNAYEEWLAERPWLCTHSSSDSVARRFFLADRWRRDNGEFINQKVYQFEEDLCNDSPEIEPSVFGNGVNVQKSSRLHPFPCNVSSHTTVCRIDMETHTDIATG